jgi:hypothetical protein
MKLMQSIICPNCDYLNSRATYMVLQSSHYGHNGLKQKMTCLECGKDFHLIVHYVVSFETKKIEDQE